MVEEKKEVTVVTVVVVVMGVELVEAGGNSGDNDRPGCTLFAKGDHSNRIRCPISNASKTGRN